MSSPEADLLKVAPNANLAEIKSAFRKAALGVHPDQNPHPDAARHFRRLNDAYRILSEQAQHREPVRRKSVKPIDRVTFLLADLKQLVKRWPEARWATMVDGLPSVVWAAGLLDVLAKNWPGLAIPSVEPTVPAVTSAANEWPSLFAAAPLPRLSKADARKLEAALTAAELRLRALDRPRRARS